MKKTLLAAVCLVISIMMFCIPAFAAYTYPYYRTGGSPAVSTSITSSGYGEISNYIYSFQNRNTFSILRVSPNTSGQFALMDCSSTGLHTSNYTPLLYPGAGSSVGFTVYNYNFNSATTVDGEIWG